MNLRLVTLNGTTLDQEVYEVMLPTTEGEIAIFPDHEALVTLAKPGVMTIRHKKTDDDNHLEHFAISGGVIEVSQNIVRVLVDTADHSDDIAEADSKAALDQALKMRDEAKDQVDREKALQLIDRHEVRLKVAELKRRNRR